MVVLFSVNMSDTFYIVNINDRWKMMYYQQIHLLVYQYKVSGILDAGGIDLTAPQDTPIAVNKETNYLIFNMDVFIQKCVDSLPIGIIQHSPLIFKIV